MPTVIDSLVVTLGLDPRQFTQAQKDAIASLDKLVDTATRNANQVEAQGKKINEVFGALKREAIGILGVFLAGRGIKDFIGYMTSLDAATGRTSYTLNMSARELSAWQGAVEQTGGSASSITGTLQGLSGEMNRFMLTGQSSLVPIINALGLGLFDGNKNLKTAGTLLLEISDAVSKMDPARATAFLSMIPGMNQDTVNLLIKGRAAVEGYLEAARKAGGTTKESAEQAAEFQKQMALLTRSAEDLSRTLWSLAASPLTNVLTKMREIIDTSKTLYGAFQNLMKFGGIVSWLSPSGIAGNIAQSLLPQSFLDASGSVIRRLMYGKNEGRGPELSLPEVNLPPGIGMKQSRGDRNNNPGNIKYGKFAADHGATGSDGTFAIFPSKDAGENAMADLLIARYSGLSLAEIQAKWVGNQDANYLSSMVAATGLAPNSVPDLRDPAMRRRLMSGMTRGEGTHLSPLSSPAFAGTKFNGGAQPSGAGAAATINTRRGGDTTTTSTTNINKIEIHSNATDAEGVARDIGPALNRAGTAASANYGME